MTRKRNGFFTFIFSLLPGAGEMYLGFLKQGASIMILFLGICAIGGMFSNGALMMLLPVIWFYSFFHVHNLNSLNDEEFYAVEDDFLILNNIVVSENFNTSKRRKILAVIIITIGVSSIWNMFMDYLRSLANIFGWEVAWLFSLLRNIPSFVISIALIAFGIYLIKGKKTEVDTYIEGDEQSGETSGN